VPRAPETNGARGADKASRWPPRALTATVSLALIEAVLESKYLKCLLVRTIFALVSIAKSRTMLLCRCRFISCSLQIPGGRKAHHCIARLDVSQLPILNNLAG
jgi:hypothetical protein